MPRCEGRPDGDCPTKANNSSVRLSQGDLMLCRECENYRFPSTSSMAAVQHDIDASDVSEKNIDIAIQCELLCFLQEKSKIMAMEHIVKICADFYTKDEIVSARNIIEPYLNQRLPRRKGSDAERSCIEDMLKVCLNPTIRIPNFYAKSLNRLPPVDSSHCDVSAILQELQLLRMEVRKSASLQTELNIVKDELQALRAEIQQIKSYEKEFPSLPITSGARDNNCTAKMSTSVSTGNTHTFVDLTRKIADDSSSFKTVVRKKSTKSVVGVSSSKKEVKAVQTVRSVDVFVSRLHPQTKPTELEACLRSSDYNFKVHDIVCTQLQSKHADLYSSFYVSIKVNSTDLKHAAKVFMSAESWPCGVFVKRYFIRKHESSQSNDDQ